MIYTRLFILSITHICDLFGIILNNICRNVHLTLALFAKYIHAFANNCIYVQIDGFKIFSGKYRQDQIILLVVLKYIIIRVVQFLMI